MVNDETYSNIVLMNGGEAEGRGLEMVETEELENSFPIKPTFINVIL